MVFALVKDGNPHLLCTCGHTAGDHLLCGDIQSAGTGSPADCTASTKLAAGGACVLSASFTPTAPGSVTGNLVLTDNDLKVSAAQQSIGLSGTGLQ